MSHHVIITAALTGVLTTRKQSPAIPYTPAEIAGEARRSVDAGASILHIHARELGCLHHIERARSIVRDGTSADHQLRVYREALGAGASDHEAQVKVVDWLVEATLEGVPA